MCGISGWLALDSVATRPDHSVLDLMLDAIKHRGPNDRGHFSEAGVSLGMTRLSINDVDGGQQPYFNEDQSVVAVFNGEIYNFLALRRELENLGHRFRSQTDGEVIVHLWEEYGSSFVERLNGMFSIALWDGERLFLCRDRFGIKPLYYTVVDKVFYFASELKSLTRLSGFCRALDHGSLRSYLNLEYVPAPHTIYRESKKLLPAHQLTVGRDGVLKPQRYWTFPRFSADGAGSLEEWGQRLRYELKRSVKQRLLADVPLGVFLSGGLDSSAITALMTECAPGSVKSFSVAFSQPTFDESTYSRRVAKFLGTEHYEQVLTPESALDIIDPLYQSMDEPLADAAIIPTYLLSQFASNEVTVCLAGEGADELLGGYPTYLAHQLARPFGYLPYGFIQALQDLVNRLPTSRKYLSFDFKLKRFCSGLGLADVERHLTWMGSIPPRNCESFLLNPQAPAFEWEPSSLTGGVERIQELDFHTYLSDGLLVKLDRATMLSSLEGRVPFLDHELVESMAALPTPFKLRGLNAKRALKCAMKGSLPEEILARPKKGFGIPMADWLRGPLKFLIDEFLCPPYLEQQGLFRVAPIQSLIQQHLSGRADQRKPLWTLLVFQRWWSSQNPTL